MQVLNLLIHEINNIDMTLGEESSGGELWGIDVPIDMVVLMDHEDLNPELYVKQLLKVCLNMEANLQVSCLVQQEFFSKNLLTLSRFPCPRT